MLCQLYKLKNSLYKHIRLISSKGTQIRPLFKEYFLYKSYNTGLLNKKLIIPNIFFCVCEKIIPFQIYKSISKLEIIYHTFKNESITGFMKEQYASNGDDPILANQRLKNKLDFLERESIKRQSYLKDIERNLKLSKQTIKLMSEKDPQKNEIISKLEQQNTILLDKLTHQHASICKLNALYLMQCQLRVEQLKSFNERISQFQQTMAELRRYLHDKQQSYTCIVEKLKRYEDLFQNDQIQMFERMINYSGVIREQMSWKDIIKQLADDRDSWRKNAQQHSQKNKKLQVLLNGLKNYEKIKQFQNFVDSLNDEQVNKISNGLVSNNIGGSFLNANIEAKNQTNLSTLVTYSQNKKITIQPNVELIRLMKKQKLNNKILQSALTQAIQKNMELLQCSKKLIQNNQQIKQEIDYIIADMVVLCKALIKFDDNYRTKLRIIKNKAKCDIEMPSYKEIIRKYSKNSLEDAQFILFTKMRRDVEELSQYIALCPLVKTNDIRSYQSPRKIKNRISQQNLQISLNGEQMQISQI